MHNGGRAMDDFETYEAIVGASFSQFYLRSKDASDDALEFGNGPIAYVVDPGEIMLTSPIQDATLAVKIRIFHERPKPLDDEWNDVVEISFRAGDSTAVTGWEQGEHDLPLPLVPGATYRLRYAIANIDQPVERHVEVGEVEQPFADMVRIDLWQAELAKAELMVQRTRGGRYWVISHWLDTLRSEMRLSRSAASETDRIVEFADRAFARFPELVQSTVDDEGKRLAGQAAVLLDTLGIDQVKEISRMPRAERAGVQVTRLAMVANLLIQRAKLSRSVSAPN